MTLNQVLLFVSIIVIAALCWGFYQWGSANARATMLAQRGDTTHLAPVILPFPLDTMTGVAQPTHPFTGIHVLAPKEYLDSAEAAALQARNRQLEAENERLRIPTVANLKDRRGGTHEVHYEPEGAVVTEMFQEAPDTTHPIQVTHTVSNPTQDFWLHVAGTLRTSPAASIQLGYKAVGLGLMWLPDAKPAPILSVHITL